MGEHKHKPSHQPQRPPLWRRLLSYPAVPWTIVLAIVMAILIPLVWYSDVVLHVYHTRR